MAREGCVSWFVQMSEKHLCRKRRQKTNATDLSRIKRESL